MPVDVVSPLKGLRVETNVTVGGSPTLLAKQNGNRKSITFQNQGGSTVFIGYANVAASGANTGYALFTGTTFTDNASDGEWWGITSGSMLVHVIEVS